jgi:hypothetical protein
MECASEEVSLCCVGKSPHPSGSIARSFAPLGAPATSVSVSTVFVPVFPRRLCGVHVFRHGPDRWTFFSFSRAFRIFFLDGSFRFLSDAMTP